MKKDSSCANCPSVCTSIFNGLSDQSLKKCDSQKITNIFKKGQTLFLQGNPPYGIFCIKSGLVKVTQMGSDGKESIVRLSKPGDAVGHRSLFSEQSYQSTATAIEDTQVCFFDKNFIKNLVHNEPAAALNIINSLGRDLGEAEHRISSFSQKNVKERLAELLIILAEGYGQEEDNKIKLNIILKREEMASIIGTASETLIRFMAELKKDHIIDQVGKTIYILNKELLLDCAGIIN